MNPAMQGRDGVSGGWREVVRRINEEAQGLRPCIPPYFRRYDAFGNEDYPSIFMKKSRRHVADTPPQPPLGLAEPTDAPHPQAAPELATGAAATGIQRVAFPGAPKASESDGSGDIVVAAVGPYHHLSPCAPPLITRAKKCGIAVFLANSRFGLDAADFLDWARRHDDRVRACYERGTLATMPSEKLAEMLLLDGCLLLFAVFLLRTGACQDQRPAELARDKDLGKEFIYLSADISLHMKQTKIDLLLLENQIPFFVLAELHRRLQGTLFGGLTSSIEDLALSCFDDIHPVRARDSHGAGFPKTISHLLHLYHWSRVPRDKHVVKSMVPKEAESLLPSATELKEFHVTITRQAAASMDVTFRSKALGTRGVMSVPPLCIRSYTEPVFRSLIAFEQSHFRCGLGATAYAICMARLLQSEADARVLRKRGILAHTHKTDEEVVGFFRGLADEYRGTYMPDDLLALFRDVAAHRQSAAGKVKGGVRRCFPRETATFFVIMGALISVATLVNTIHSMYRYYHPLKPYRGF